MTQMAIRSAQDAAALLKKLSPEPPAAAIVLGSGVKVLEDLSDATTVPYLDAFGKAPGVVGHSGTISIGNVNGKRVAVLRGRFHLYEGYDWELVTLPARAIAEWGVPNLLLTNAAGGINDKFKVGDLMVITGYRDHLNPALRETGLIPELRRQPVDCKNELVQRILNAGTSLAASDKAFRPLQQGVYAALLGPTYETLAEIEMLRKLKADAVGMSTVPEMLAVAGTKCACAAVSVVTNVWNPDEIVGGHEEVLAAAKEASSRLDKLFHAVISGL